VPDQPKPLKIKRKSVWGSINYEACNLCLETLGKVFILLAAIFALVKYNNYLEARRTDTTFKYIERHDTGDISQSRLILANMQRAYESDFLALSSTGITRKDSSLIVESLLELPENENAKDALNRLDDFYLGLNLCVEMNTCSKHVVESYFCPNRARKIWQIFGDYFINRRDIIDDYGAGIETCATYSRKQK
jgi:hypothetical protein